ncbi:hypothetical protein Bca4012_093760 [Brassica carinata]
MNYVIDLLFLKRSFPVNMLFSLEEVSSQNQVKTSVQRRIRQSIQDEYPGLETVMEDLLPKKSPLIVVKCPNHLTLVVVNNVPLFFCIRDGPYMPTLRLLHQYPNIMKRFQVDRGAIKFVFSGANIMCPGLTSPGGVLDEEVDAERPVAIYAEGKQHALAIGFTKMSAKDIKSINKGIGVDNMHYLNDGLWKVLIPSCIELIKGFVETLLNRFLKERKANVYKMCIACLFDVVCRWNC